MKYFNRISDADISHVAPFVRHVNFIPSLHSHLIDYNHFQNMIQVAATRRLGCYRVVQPHRPLSPPPPAWSTQRREFSTHLHSQQQIKHAYATYKAAANANLDLLLGDTSPLHAAWTRILTALPDCHSFRFALVDYIELDMALQPAYPDCLTRPIGEDGNAVNCSEEIAARMADQFVPRAISILVESGAKVHSLAFAQAVTHYGKYWENVVGWGRLDLKQLRSLTFEPSLWARARPRDKAALPAVQALLRVTGETLEHLDCVKATTITWKGLQLIAFPKLETLGFAGQASSNYLAEWIEACPELKKVVLKSMELEGEPPSNWKMVVDVLRDHPNSPRIELRGTWSDVAYSALLPPGSSDVELNVHTSSLPVEAVWDTTGLF